jgi:hypothetical protein
LHDAIPQGAPLTKQEAKVSDCPASRFLAKLMKEDASLRDAKIVPLKFRERIVLQDASIDANYFPLACFPY